MFTYAQVETALAAVFGVPSAARKAFIARIKHLRRLGVVPSSPGKGRRVDYDLIHVYEWAFCLELAAFGIDPKAIKEILHQEIGGINSIIFDDQVADWFPTPHTQAMIWPPLPSSPSAAKGDLFYFFHPNLHGWPQAIPPAPVSIDGAPLTRLIARDLSELDRQARTPQAKQTAERFRARYGVINLTKLRRDVEEALSRASAK
jgi:hypothetical protein